MNIYNKNMIFHHKSAHLFKAMAWPSSIFLLPGNQAVSYSVASYLFIKALGLIYLVAFSSFWIQAHGLIGSKGILPIQCQWPGNYLRMPFRDTVCLDFNWGLVSPQHVGALVYFVFIIGHCRPKFYVFSMGYIVTRSWILSDLFNQFSKTHRFFILDFVI